MLEIIASLFCLVVSRWLKPEDDFLRWRVRRHFLPLVSCLVAKQTLAGPQVPVAPALLPLMYQVVTLLPMYRLPLAPDFKLLTTDHRPKRYLAP